jgi:hypothetical protein
MDLCPRKTEKTTTQSQPNLPPSITFSSVESRYRRRNTSGLMSQKAGLDAKTDAFDSTAELATLRNGLEILEEKVLAPKSAYCR